ncbi:MAG: hypothetical protein IIC84_09250, partial [Chloroflexi bacterium]|nr:hypothetical protein [Chloroflexota bacterium]
MTLEYGLNRLKLHVGIILGGTALRLTGLAVLVALLGLAAVGCSSSYAVGNALLPEGMETAQIPNVELTGYLYVNAESTISLPVDGSE